MHCLQEIKVAYIVKSDREFCKRIDYASQNLSQISKGKRDVTIELIRKAVETFNFSADYIFTGKGKPIRDQEFGNSPGVSFAEIRFVKEYDYTDYIKEVNEDKAKVIAPYYYLSSSVPDDIRLFEVRDNALTPYLDSGDVLICKRIQPERWDRLIRDYYVHVVISEKSIYISRVHNELKRNQEIELLDVLNESKTPLIVEEKEIKEIWEITHIIKRWTIEMNADSATLDIQLNQLSQAVNDNGGSLKDLNLTIEKLLRQMRELSSQGR